MKNRKILILIIFTLILVINFIFKNNTNDNINREVMEANYIFPLLSDSDPIAEEWYRIWGGNKSEWSNTLSIDSSDNIYLAGYSTSFGAGDYDMCLVKYNRFGAQLWNCVWGGNYSEYCYAMVIDSSDNIYLAGNTYSFSPGDVDMCLVKFNSSGIQLWNKTWGGDQWDGCKALALDSSDNVYLAGSTGSFSVGSADICIVKYNSSGIQQWNKTWGGDQWDSCEVLVIDSSDNIYLGGGTKSFSVGNADICLVKYNSSGIQQWNRTWGGSDDDECKTIVLDSLNNIYITGNTESFGAGEKDMCLVKFNSYGLQVWNRTWGGSDYDECRTIILDSSNNIYLAGDTESRWEEFDDICLVKFDSSGVLRWNRTWGGSGFDRARGVASDSSDNIYIAGHTASFGAGDHDMFLVKYDNSGVQQWNRTWGGWGYDWCEAITLDSLNNIYLVGSTSSFGAGDHDMCLVKYDNSGVQQWNLTWGRSDEDWGRGMVIDSSDNVYLAGRTRNISTMGYDMCLIKYNNLGVQQWNRTWAGGGPGWISGVILGSNDNIYLAGYTDRFLRDLCLLKYISSGILQWNKTWVMDDGDYCGTFTLDSSENIYFAGSTYDMMSTQDVWLVKYTSSGTLQWNKTWGGYNYDICSAIILDSLEDIYLTGSTKSFGAGNSDMLLMKIPNPPGIIIPGYNLILLISLICGVSVILINKCYKLNKKYN